MTATFASKLSEIAERYGVRDVYAFGSRAGEARARVAGALDAPVQGTSDLDIAVQPGVGHTLSPRERVRLTDELESLFGVSRVDLVVLGEAPSLLAVEVIRGELLHTTDPLAQAEHELYVLRRAADLAPFQKERTRRILREGAR